MIITKIAFTLQWPCLQFLVVKKYIEDAESLIARGLIAPQDKSKMASALDRLDAALAISPLLDWALELKARTLLCLQRFKDVAGMFQNYIPSMRMAEDHPVSVSSSSSGSPVWHQRFKCFSVSGLKKKVMTSLGKRCEKEGQWRYLVLGEACYHLGLLEDAMVLLQKGKRLAGEAFQRESVCWSDDNFSLTIGIPFDGESVAVAHLLSHIKFLLCRRASGLAALDAGLYPEAIRQYSKILDHHCAAAVPQGFLGECYMDRASAYRSAGQIADSIADCNCTLALDPNCIQALETRASLFETIRCFSDSLQDLEHLKLLYKYSILRPDRELPGGPAWNPRHNARYWEMIHRKLCALIMKIQELKQVLNSGYNTGNGVDYYTLIGMRRGCSRSEVEGAYVLLRLRHEPGDAATSFIERCEFTDERDAESVKERAEMSASLLYRLVQKGYTRVITGYNSG